jgi:anaphase-promoting complex subunit 2
LLPTDNGKPSHISNDLLEAFSYLLGTEEAEKDLVAWYNNEVYIHLRNFVLPELQVWQQPIPLSKADQVLRLTLDLLLRAKQHYIGHLDSLIASMQRPESSTHISRFRIQVQRNVYSLILHSLPRQRLQQTLASVFYHHLVLSLQQSSNPERCLKDQQCHCKVDLGDLPLMELNDVGLGGLLAERALAHALHWFLQGTAIERRCFAVDWTGHGLVVPKLRAWVEQHVMPMVERALAIIKADHTTKMAPNDTQQLISIAVNNIGRARTSSLFDYVRAWPASTGAVLDIYEYLNAGSQADKAHVCQSFTEQIQRRLLHAGATTAEILGIYVNMIHTFKALDGRGVLLEKVAVPIRNYLRSRDDTVSIIAASFLADVDEEGHLAPADQDKACLDIAMEVSNTALGGSRENHSLNWNDMEWVPDPIDAGPDYRSSNSEDGVAQVLGLFEQEEFIKEVTTVLAQHLLHSTDMNYVKETRLVELLKSRLDAAKLQAAEVMLKDMRDSVTLGKRINPAANYDSSTAVPTPREIQAAIPKEGITLASLYSLFENRIKQPQFLAAIKLVANKRNDLFYAKRTRIPQDPTTATGKKDTTTFKTQILSSFFWPQLRSNEFNMPHVLEPLQTNYEEKFDALGSQRRLRFRPALARVSLKLELEDRVIEEADVPGWRASVIDAFTSSEPDTDSALTVERLMDVLQMEEELVRDALDFWMSKSVLYQRSPGSYAVLERLDMDIGAIQQQIRQHDDMVSAVKSQDAMLRESAPVFETFIANMLQNQGAKEIGGMMGITNLLKMVLPTFTYGDEEVRWLLSEMEKEGEVTQSDGGLWSVAK